MGQDEFKQHKDNPGKIRQVVLLLWLIGVYCHIITATSLTWLNSSDYEQLYCFIFKLFTPDQKPLMTLSSKSDQSEYCYSADTMKMHRAAWDCF